MKKGIHIVNLKSKMKICHLTTFYSIFIMCSCRKPEIQQDLPKLTKNQMNLPFFLIVFKNPKLCLFHHVLTTNQLIFKNR